MLIFPNDSNSKFPICFWRPPLSQTDVPSNFCLAGFAYFDTGSGVQALTWLVSDALDANETSSSCLEFWFASAATDEDTSLSVKRRFPNGTFHLLWKVSHRALLQQGDDDAWRFGLVPLPTEEESTLVSRFFFEFLPNQSEFIMGAFFFSQLVLEGISSGGGFAVDDIKVTHGDEAANCQRDAFFQKTKKS